MTQTTIRRATVSDASKLAQLQEHTFRDTFETSNSAHDMALHCQSHYSPALQEQEITDPDLITLLCVEQETFCGFAQLRRGATPACIPGNQSVEIQRLYVDRKWHGQGVAQRLMTACLTEAARLKIDQIWLGVWENNSRAIRFYSKFGFVEVGSHIFMVGSDAQRDLIMHRPVNPIID